MSLLTVQRSPTPSDSSEKSENVSVLEPPGEIVTNKSSNASTSEDFMAVNGAAIALPANRRRQSVQDPPIGLQSHMHHIFNKLRSSEDLKLVVKLEALGNLTPDYDRYFCLVSCTGRQGTEESVILGCDLTSTTTSIGLVIPVMLDMEVNLHGEGGFKVIVKRDHDYFFKPISVQALWATLQALHLAIKVARDNNYYAKGLSHTWITYYISNINSTRLQINEWRRTEESDEESRGFATASLPHEIDDRRRLENEIRTKLREVMLKEDLEVVTVSQLRQRLTEKMDIDLVPFRNFIGESVIFIFGQLESPSKIFDHVYLGSKWNACNIEELQQIGIGYIINITKEIDNFFPDVFNYFNVPLYDVEDADLMSYWEETHKFINQARDNDSRVFVHCKMGMSRSASTVMAYAMKEYGWSYEKARKFVKERRPCVHPNEGFLAQLRTYEGILAAKSNRKKFNAPKTSDSSEVKSGPNPSGHRRALSDLDQPINIEQDILQYKRQPNIADPKGIPSSPGSMETSGDSMPPSNPSIAPDPMDEVSAEIGAGGGVVKEDPRSRDMQNVRSDLIIRKDPCDAPWLQLLRRKKSGTEIGDEDEPGPPDTIEIITDDVMGGNGPGPFRSDVSWIRDSDPTSSDVGPTVPVFTLGGDIPGEETSTDPPTRSESIPTVVCSPDKEVPVVMRDHDSLPPSGTVKRESVRLESRGATHTESGVELATAAAAPSAPSDSGPNDFQNYVHEDIPLQPGTVKKVREGIEKRERASGEIHGSHSPTSLRVSGGELGANRFSGGGLSPVAPAPAASGSPSSPPLPLQPDLAQVHQKMLQLIRQIGNRLHQRNPEVHVQSVVREVENSVDRDPIRPVRHLVEVFRVAS